MLGDEYISRVYNNELFACTTNATGTTGIIIEGGPEPLEKESNEFLGSKRDDRFSNPFLEMVLKTCQGCFSYLLWHDNFCKGPRTLQKFPQKCQKIAGC